MTTPAALLGGKTAPYGYGLQLGSASGQPYIGHQGDAFGFSALVYRFPRLNLNVAICSNVLAESASAARAQLAFTAELLGAIIRNAHG